MHASKGRRGKPEPPESRVLRSFSSCLNGGAPVPAVAYKEKLRRKFREMALKSLHDHHTARLAWDLRRSRQFDLRDGRFGTGRRVEQPNRSSRTNLRRTA
jgi:hypothetical protein